MPGASTHFHRILKERIEKAIVDYATHMVGGGCEDYAAYREGVGVVMGYKKVLQLCEEIERSLDD